MVNLLPLTEDGRGDTIIDTPASILTKQSMKRNGVSISKSPLIQTFPVKELPI